MQGMTDTFWDSPSEFSVIPPDPNNAPNGVINPYLTLFGRVDFSFNGLVEELAEVEGVQIAPFDSYHLTVKQIGEVEEDSLPTLLETISRISDIVDPFTVQFRGVGVFPTCIYVPVVLPSPLEQFHELLCEQTDIDIMNFEGEEYIPHITIAKFTSTDVDTEAVRDILSNYRDKNWAELQIETLYLVKDTPTGEDRVFYPFESVGEFTFQSEPS